MTRGLMDRYRTLVVVASASKLGSSLGWTQGRLSAGGLARRPGRRHLEKTHLATE